MRACTVILLVLAACQSSARDGAAADRIRVGGKWIGLDESGARWWRLDLREGRVGRGAFESNGAVARYLVTDWTSDDDGAVLISMSRKNETTAVDAAPARLELRGKCDGVWLRLWLGRDQLVLLREDNLIPARTRLMDSMQTE